LAILGTNVGNYVPMGTFFCAGDIRAQTESPKGLSLEGLMSVIMFPWGHSSVPGTSADKNYSPKGLFLEGHSTIIGTNACNYVPMGTFFYTGDIRGQKLFPKGTIPRGTFDYVRDYCR
jgi:hypothetical protein